ncbi:MAG TPA: hypothetical protein VES60_11800 [Nakamurella sp.]|nr:hypothetical protein [Nakamurella sp.]
MLAIELGTNVNISLVSTAPAARRRRRPAGAVLAAALREAAERGWLTRESAGQPIAESLYARSG